jgi:hypothetical protein
MDPNEELYYIRQKKKRAILQNSTYFKSNITNPFKRKLYQRTTIHNLGYFTLEHFFPLLINWWG